MPPIGRFTVEEFLQIANIQSIMQHWLLAIILMGLGFLKTLGEHHGEKMVSLDWVPEIPVQ
jgi:hypothetical protein